MAGYRFGKCAFRLRRGFAYLQWHHLDAGEQRGGWRIDLFSGGVSSTGAIQLLQAKGLYFPGDVYVSPIPINTICRGYCAWNSCARTRIHIHVNFRQKNGAGSYVIFRVCRGGLFMAVRGWGRGGLFLGTCGVWGEKGVLRCDKGFWNCSLSKFGKKISIFVVSVPVFDISL